MTRDEFNEQRFGAETMFRYEGVVCDVVALHFPEGLLGLDLYNDRSDLTWVRCESGEIVRTDAEEAEREKSEAFSVKSTEQRERELLASLLEKYCD